MTYRVIQESGPALRRGEQRSLRVFFLAIFVVSILLSAKLVCADHALALGYTPKYPPDFKHFDYVNPDALKGGEIVLSALGNFDSLNPYILRVNPAQGIALMFDTLTDKSEDEPITSYGLLAEDMVLAPDKLSVTFRLNPKARFSDGSPVTAKDVKFSFDTLKSKLAHPQFQFYWADVKQAVIVDPMTIRFEFVRQNAELHVIIGELPVFSRKWGGGEPFDKIVDDPPIASGPYLLDKYEVGRRIVYKRNPNYWAKELPIRRGMFNFDRITFRYYKDPAVRLEAFKAGEFDFIAENTAKNWAKNYKGEKFDAGLIKKTELSHNNAAGMQGFVFNTRRSLFKDKRVRRAITLALDFEWLNKRLFYGQYTRAYSYFSNSEMAARGLPQGEELALLESFRDKLPPEAFASEWLPPSTDIPGSLRQNLRQAKKLLADAGWHYRGGALRDDGGRPFEFEILVSDKAIERIIPSLTRNLAILGIQAQSRMADPALYQRRLERFDFDMTVHVFGTSQNPGNELISRFAAKSASEEGSDNVIGIMDPVVDALIEKILTYSTRNELLAATRALDRVLLAGEYIVPNWFISIHRIAYYDKFEFPRKLPLYYAAESWMLSTWWKKAK